MEYREFIDFLVNKDKESLNQNQLHDFKRLNTTTRSIYDLEDNQVLIILKDGTNLTCWGDVEDKNDILYIMEDLSDKSNLEYYYNGLKNTQIIITTNITDKIRSLSGFFSGCKSLHAIYGLDTWDTSNVEGMDYMFYDCIHLKYIDKLSSLDTKNVTTMKFMFSKCISLYDYSLLKTWNTANVVDMSGMFYNTFSFIDYEELKHLSTAHMTEMGVLYRKKAESLKVDLSSLSFWDTSSLKNINAMFYGCECLDKISWIKKWGIVKQKGLNELIIDYKSGG